MRLTRACLLLLGSVAALCCLAAAHAARVPASWHDLIEIAKGSKEMSTQLEEEGEKMLTPKEAILQASADPDPNSKNFCHKKHYRKRTMKVIKEAPFIGLFPDLQGQRRFEASGITEAKGSFWVIFDNLLSLGKLDLQFKFRGPENALIAPEEEAESQFEGLSYMESSDTFLALRESFEHDEHGLVPLTVEVAIEKDGASHKILRSCPIQFVLQDGNKGFESLHFYEEKNAAGGYDKFILGMCESNFCATIIGDDPPGLQRGNGRLVHAKYLPPTEEDDECHWKVQKVITIPETAYFLDYSAIAFNGRHGADVAITSQEDAATWVGKFDWTQMEFVADVGDVFHFPRDEDCYKVYCNVEGVAWLDSSRLVLTSDRSKNTQDHRCMAKDQSVHVMALP